MKELLAAVIMWAIGIASAFTWAASGYPTVWLVSWLGWWTLALIMCGLATLNHLVKH